jgi:hypothetical protein
VVDVQPGKRERPLRLDGGDRVLSVSGRADRLTFAKGAEWYFSA